MNSTSLNPSGPEPYSLKAMLIGFLALVTVPILLLPATGVAYLRGWRTWTRLDTLVMWALAAVLLFGVVGLLPARGRRFFRQRWAHLVLLNGAVWGACLLAEAGLALVGWGAPPPHYHTRPPAIQKLFKPVPEVMPGIAGESKLTTNRLGIRGPEWPPRDAAYRILCVGGSTTECVYLDDAESWPQLIMDALNHTKGFPPVWVGNIGISGYATIEHLKFVRDSELMGQVDCLVFLPGINDLVKYLAGDADQVEGVEPFWSRSRIMNVMRLVWFGHSPAGNIQVEDAVGASYVVRRRERHQGPVCETPPDLEPALRAYEGRLRSILDECRRAGVRVVCLSHPVLWAKRLHPQTDKLLWMGWNDRRQFLTAEQLRAGIDRYNAVLGTLCREAAVEFVDLSFMSGRKEFFYDDCHFNEAGAREVARWVSDWLVNHPPQAR